MVVLASSSGEVWTEISPWARISRDELRVETEWLRADATSLEVSLGPGLHARFADARGWPRRPFSPLGPAQMVPFLGQYWAPWLLAAEVSGAFGERSLDGAGVYAEKNWGAAFADHWWWGQAEFVAFAGGRVHGVAPTAVAVWTPSEVVTLAPPLARTVTRAGGGEWSVRASSWRWHVELSGEASSPLLLPVPIPGRERRLEVRSRHHLLGRVQVEVRRGRRVWFRGESSAAALEDGATPS
jgi:tocopherol cyclase